LHGIPRDQLNVIDIQAPEAVDALTQGDVDGLVAWQPNALTLEERLGGNAKTWSIQNGQPTYCLLTTTDSWANEHPELVDRLLRSLAEAESYLINNPKRSKDLIQKRLGYDDAYIRRIWPEHQPSLSLDQSLILAMEDQARWMINNGLTDKQTIPDFEKYVYDKALAAVKPESVHIIHGGAKH
jgi:NitT/TauT family transport system substrate-binding protein